MVGLYKALVDTIWALGPWVSVGLVVVLTLLGTGVSLGAIIFLPADHFCDGRTAARLRLEHPVIRVALLTLKNLVGLVMIPLGVVMSLPLVPGPGVVFVLLGVSLVDFPGKRRLERRLLAVPSVRKFIDRVRLRFGRSPLELD